MNFQNKKIKLIGYIFIIICHVDRGGIVDLERLAYHSWKLLSDDMTSFKQGWQVCSSGQA